MKARCLCIALVFGLLCPYASAQWVQTSGLDSCVVGALAVCGTNLYAATWGTGVFRSNDSGRIWTAVNMPLSGFSSMAQIGSILFAGTAFGVFLSTNDGTNWTLVNTGLTSPDVSALVVSDTNLFAGTWDGVFLFTNKGTSWTAANTGLTNTSVQALAVSGTNLFAGTGSGVYLSTNDGTSWTAVNTGLTNINVRSLAVSGTNLFAGTGSGVYRSTNNGTSWTEVNMGLPPNAGVGPFVVSGTNLFVCTGTSVFLSNNNGMTWSEVNSGLANVSVRSLAVSGTNLVAGTDGRGVWRRPLSEMITSVEPTTSALPNDFLLAQNYPNPFNPNSDIRYQISEFSQVKMAVYDLLGREVAVLVNEKKAPGSYEVKFDGSYLASGVYLYRLHAGSFVETRKLILLR